MVSSLMKELFKFIKSNKDKIHPLILSSVFHYEFVFIHPFSDGNGRMARLWQNILLYQWRNIFEYLPIESKIYKYQNEYYKAISECHKNGNSNVFICFMLKMIEETIDEAITTSNVALTNELVNVNKLLDVMEPSIPLTALEIMTRLGIKSKETLRNSYLNPAIKLGMINLTSPLKPTSKNQMYYKS